MKNKMKIISYFLIFFLFIGNNNVYSDKDKIQYKADKIKILNEGNLIIGDGNVEVKIGDNIFLIANSLKYNRNLNTIEILDNVKFEDNKNKIKASSSKIVYDENNKILEIRDNVNFKDYLNNIEIKSSKVILYRNKSVFEISDNVELTDFKNQIELFSDKIFFSRIFKKIYSDTQTKIIYDKKYIINLSDFIYEINNQKIISKAKTTVEDNLNNFFELNEFLLNSKLKRFSGKKVNFVDEQKNKYQFKDVMIDTKNKNIFGRDLNINFNKKIFNNEKNDPRINARSVKIKGNSSLISKGVFTTCNKDQDCPPWSIYAEEIEHDKELKKISYKNAWLKIYDFPAAYFPRFSHPDPSVKRKSGFLAPKFSSTNNLGSAISVPYFHVISENQDLTFKPKIFFDDKIVLQTEYRQVNKSSDHIIDFSVAPSNYLSTNSTKMHFFSNSKFNLNNNFFDSSDLELNIERVNHDDYLNLYNINHDTLKSDNDANLTHSFLNYSANKEDLNFSTSFEVYEDLTKDKSNRHEFIYPKYNFQKKINSSENNNRAFLKSYGSQRKYNTNIYEGILINDYLFNSENKYSLKGFVTNFNTLIKNVNVDANNSKKHKDKFEKSISTIIQYNTEYPLIKNNNNSLNYFTPKMSLMYSPNKTKNLNQDNLRVDASNIFSFNRIANNETVEGGASLTYGMSFNKTNKLTNREVLNLDIATLLRHKENLDLPSTSSLGKKTSDIFGNLEIYPDNIYSFKYNFALDNNFNKTNYDSLGAKISVNNFVTEFEYSDEKNNITNESFVSNKTSLKLNDNSSLNFNLRRNNEISATEYYNIMYQYRNDCLTASLKFNKEFYRDSDLKPEKEIFFTIGIIPFANMDGLN